MIRINPRFKNNLFRRPLPTVTPFTPAVTIYDARHNSGYRQKPLPRAQPSPFSAPNILSPSHQCQSEIVRCYAVKVPNPSAVVRKYAEILKCVSLKKMESAPPQEFWPSMAIGGGQLVIPILELIGGYSPVLTLLQLNVAAVTLAYMGGTRWGLALTNDPDTPFPDWDTWRRCALPPAIGVIALLLPYPLGFLTVTYGMLNSLYLDSAFMCPHWALATRMFVTLSSVVGLLLALIAYLYHDRNEKEHTVQIKEVD